MKLIFYKYPWSQFSLIEHKSRERSRDKPGMEDGDEDSFITRSRSIPDDESISSKQELEG